jgi:hypothetical protein
VTGSEIARTRRCENCLAPLYGEYCSACGQRSERHLHSLWGFLREGAESLTHADSRIWRTLWTLLAKPGFLTKEFLEGRRARYLPPFRLYLVLSVVLFVITAAGSHDVRFLQFNASGELRLSHDDDEPIAGVKIEPAAKKNSRETPAQRAHRICDDATYDLVGKAFIEPRMRAGCRKIIMDGGRGVAEAFYHNVPRALVVLLPLLALVMKLMYLRRYYVEHLLFFVHTHAFAFLFLIVYVLAVRFIPWGWFAGLMTTALILIIPYYTYRAMLRVYAQGRWLTRLKFSVLALLYFVFGSIMAVVLGLYTMVTL